MITVISPSLRLKVFRSNGTKRWRRLFLLEAAGGIAVTVLLNGARHHTRTEK